MKKSVLILIAVIYVVAIFMVSFIGLKIGFYDEIMYVESISVENIECENCTVKTAVENGVEYKYAVVQYEDDPENPTAVQIIWKLNPDNATNKKVTFEYDKSKTIGYVTETGTVVFNKKGTINVYILATDGSGQRAMVKIIAK